MIHQKRLKVFIHGFSSSKLLVGELYQQSTKECYFQYDSHFLEIGFNISPFKLQFSHLPQKTDQPNIFDGLFGVFADSLPDGWGLLLMKRKFLKQGINFEEIGPLDRLFYIGDRGFGALSYEPAMEISWDAEKLLDLKKLSSESEKILMGDYLDVIPELLIAGGSPAGARPKISVCVHEEDIKNLKKNIRLCQGDYSLPYPWQPWIIKFNSKFDDKENGILEWIYAEAAKKAGITMEQTHLFQLNENLNFFGVKRFDRRTDQLRLHCHSLAGLLHSDFRIPALDYETVLKTVRLLTKNEHDVSMMFRIAVFNVYFHNQDDHAKNISFLMDNQGSWSLAPAYDLTFSMGPGGEHMTSVLGKGKNISTSDLIELAKKSGIEKQTYTLIMEQVKESFDSLKRLLKEYKINKNHPIYEWWQGGV